MARRGRRGNEAFVLLHARQRSSISASCGASSRLFLHKCQQLHSRRPPLAGESSAERERAGEHEGIDRATQDALDAMLEEKRRRKIYYVPAAATTKASEDRPSPSFLPSRVLRHFLRCTETRLDCLAVMRARTYSRFFSDKPALASSFSPLPKPWSRLFEAPVASGFVAASILILIFYITIVTCHQRDCSGALFSFSLLCKSNVLLPLVG